MILCAGEALIDMLPRTSDAGEDAFAPKAGGAVFNTAIALGRLEAEVGFYGGLSTDLFGAKLEASLTESGADASFAHRSARPTTLAFVELVNGQARYAFYDENTAARMLTPEDLPDASALAPVKAAFFGGISLVVEPCGGAYEALMTRLAPNSVTMIDPNIRPGFIQDEAAYRARLDRMLALADIVKVSDEDLEWLMGPGDLATLAADMRARGPALVCVTEGAKGVTAYSAAAPVTVAATPVEVVDTVGAGDTFNAGLLAELQRSGALTKSWLQAPQPETLAAALTLGVKAAAVTVSRAGANPPTRAELT